MTEIGAGNTCNAQGQSCDQVFCEQKHFFYWIVSVICVNGCLGHHGGKQFSFTPETNAHVESRQISKPNLVLKSSYKQRPCEGIYILPSSVRFFLRIPRVSSVCAWISHKCTVYIRISMSICDCMHLILQLEYQRNFCLLITYSGPSHFELSWHEMHIGKHNQNCGEH